MKKTILFVALAVAIVIGCTTEVLDTSYESVLSEALTKGDHPMALNAYVGNGMMQTRSTLEAESSGNTDRNTVVNKDESRMDGVNMSSYSLISRSAGVFAYYSGTAQVDNVTYTDNFYNTSSSSYSYTTNDRLSSDEYYESDVISKYLNNAQLYYSNSDWKTKLLSGGGADWTDAQVYWPTLTNTNSSGSGDEYMTFFAYYPHVNTYSNEYGKYGEKNNLFVETAGELGYPMLDYTVATAIDNYPSLDLMVAKPVVNQKIQDYSKVDFEFKHLLAAVSVNLQYKEDNTSSSSSSSSPYIFFTRASMQGVSSSGEVSEDSQFRKRGVFSMAKGQWIHRNDFEPLDLLAYSWLTQTDKFNLEVGKYYPLFDDGKPSTGNSSLTVDDASLSRPGGDKFMFIIPNDKQEKLKVNLGYTIISDGFSENVDLSKEIDLQFKPGYIYQINLVIDKKKLEFNVEVNDWTYDSSDNPHNI